MRSGLAPNDLKKLSYKWCRAKTEAVKAFVFMGFRGVKIKLNAIHDFALLELSN